MKSILILNDAGQSLDDLAGVIEQNGYELRPITEQDDPVGVFLEREPDLIFISLMAGNAVEACESIRDKPEGAITPIIFIGTGDAFLLALDPATGELVAGFGADGRVDLAAGLRRPVDRDLYGVTSPPVICGGVVIVGSSISDDPLRPGMPPGDVRGFDPRHEAFAVEIRITG